MPPGWPTFLHDGDVVLRPYRRGDAQAWSESRRFNESWLVPWEPTPPLPWYDAHSPAAFRGLYRILNRSAKAGVAMPFAICLEDRLVGQLTIGNIIRGAFCSGYAGYWIDSRVAGRGVMPTALALAVDHVFGAGELHRVEVNIRPTNTASRRVVEKLGFREEAFHPRYLHNGGAWQDHLGYALTVEDVEVEGGLLSRWHRVRSR